MKNPNIIFILIDDMGYKDLTIYGSNFYETPNIDSIGNEGIKFTNGYAASPVCSPARASIISGKYPLRVDVTHYLGAKVEKGKCIGIENGQGLDPSEPSLIKMLKENGYDAWHVGKWHLGEDKKYWPLSQGFDKNVGGCSFGHPFNGYFSPYDIPELKNGKDGEYLTDRLTTDAIDLIKNRDEDKPFYLNMWYYSVHTPIQAKKEKIEKYEKKRMDLGLDKLEETRTCENFPWEDIKDMNVIRRLVQSDPTYAAMIESLDENVGRLLNALKEEGISEDTMIVFTSDNGGLATSEGSPTSNLPLRDGKGWMYEGGVREPLLVKYPKLIKENSINETKITSPDFLPTFIELLGSEYKYDDKDGRSFYQALKGNTLERDPLYWHYPHYGNQGGSPYSSVIDGDYKLILHYETDDIELFNIKEDIGEKNEISSKYREKAVKMEAMLKNWLEESGAKIPAKNPNW